ncbi:MAG: hypothetical protein AAF513_05720 [Pseudomonadota bacterium]
MFRPPLAAQTCAIATLCVVLSGCISYKTGREAVITHIADPDILNDIEMNQTPASWLVDNLGKPHVVEHPRQNVEVWKYHNIVAARTELRALPLLSIDLEDEHHTVYSFTIQNEVIVAQYTRAGSP